MVKLRAFQAEELKVNQDIKMNYKTTIKKIKNRSEIPPCPKDRFGVASVLERNQDLQPFITEAEETHLPKIRQTAFGKNFKIKEINVYKERLKKIKYLIIILG